MRISEIQRQQSDTQPLHMEVDYESVAGLNPVPQNPEYAYTIANVSDQLSLVQADTSVEFYHVKNDGARFIGFINLRRIAHRGLKNPVQVSNVALDSDFRNRGVGLMMYGVILGLGHTIVADDSQTSESRKLWVRLWNMPGVTVRGMIDVLSSYVDPEKDNSWNNEAKQIKSQLKRIKAQPLQDFNRRRDRYGDEWERYSFEVMPKTDGSELAAPGISIYSRNSSYDDYDPVGLYATMN